ncbi:MAG: HPr(Ser) kinase/phosphatase [Candidatus Zixiibacteriota bacterium]|nr:MAG: HPr(Ser) kinase/phosphatase [candidate division Zixibacteria bacterium]
MEIVTVEKIFRERKEGLELTLLTNEMGLKKVVPSNEIHRPGLALAGFVDRVAGKRTQVLGETEMSFLSARDESGRRKAVENIFRFDLPCVIVTKGITAPVELLELAEKEGVPVFSSRLSTVEFINRLGVYLDNLFAPHTTIHGTLVDVYGVGLLYTGKSGVGKSECALDLVERGHRLVADDVVQIIRKAPQVIVGTGSELLGHHMEVRGIGIINIEKLFGIRAIRMQKRIEVQVNLAHWDDQVEFERLGVEDKYTTILGVEIPVVTIPVSPGKDITVISEVIAMNHMLKVYGEDSAKVFSKRHAEEIYRRKMVGEFLESDFE